MHIKKFTYDTGTSLYSGWGGGWPGVTVTDKTLYQ